MSIKDIAKQILSIGHKTIVKVTLNTVAPSERFTGKKVLVTGGGSGIGFEIAKEFLAEGAEVMITGRNKERLEEAKQKLNNPKVKVMDWDVADVKELDEKFVTAVEVMSAFDIFINNAGIYAASPWNQIKEEEYDKVSDINCKGLFFMCQHEADYFLKNNIKGKIVNINSIAGIKSGFDAYSVSKWGSMCITRSLAAKMAPYGIVINGIAPGNVVTNIHDGVRGKNVMDNAYMPQHKTNRYTLVEEIASMALYLSSDMASNIIGQVIAIDGGWVLN